MPKKGEKQPYRVIYEYPNGVKGRIPCGSYNGAEMQAGMIGLRGATVTLALVGEDGKQQKILAMFGPNQPHVFRPRPGEQPGTTVLRCACSYTTPWEGNADWHLEHAGLCSKCWGTMLLHERVTADDGTVKAGPLVACPYCGDTGRAADMNYDVEAPESYVTRMQALEQSLESTP